MKFMLKLFSISILTFVIIGSIHVIKPNKAVADVIQPDECYPAVLMFRGSGENQTLDDGSTTKTYKNSTNNTIIETNGYEGRIISLLLKKFAEQTDASQTVSKTRFIGVDYPALPVFPDLTAPNVNNIWEKNYFKVLF